MPEYGKGLRKREQAYRRYVTGLTEYGKGLRKREQAYRMYVTESYLIFK